LVASADIVTSASLAAGGVCAHALVAMSNITGSSWIFIAVL
jgi:hypothetical protein